MGTYFPTFLIFSLASGGISSTSSSLYTHTRIHMHTHTHAHTHTHTRTHTHTHKHTNTHTHTHTHTQNFSNLSAHEHQGLTKLNLTSFPNACDTRAGFFASTLGLFASGAAYITQPLHTGLKFTETSSEVHVNHTPPHIENGNIFQT